MSCIDKLLTSNILDDLKAKEKGLRGCNLLIVNRAEIDSYTLDASNEMIVTDLALISLKTAFELPNYKQLNQVTFEFVPSDEDIDGYTHVLNGVVREMSADNLLRIKEMQDSQDGFVVIVQKLEQGVAKADNFEIYGLEAGMHLLTVTGDSREYLRFTLSTKDTYVESAPPRKLLITDYDTTKTAYDNVFVGA